MESSKLNKKYSIATVVVADPSTPASRSSFTTGRRASGLDWSANSDARLSWQFPKKLIDETGLPMSQIALASGFGSVRRFNAGIRNGYHRTPTQLRRLARKTAVQFGN